MGIPYWREVGYCDDGVTEYQCLSCKSKWQSRGYGLDFKYCPYCGIEWAGSKEWDTNAREQQRYNYHRALRSLREPIKLNKYYIMERFAVFDHKTNQYGEYTDWSEGGYRRGGDYVITYDLLKELRREEHENRDSDDCHIGKFDYMICVAID